SNFSAEQIASAAAVAADKGWTPFTGTQIDWSLLSRGVEESIVPAAVKAGVGVVPYFPLASGMLTGKYRRNDPLPAGTRLANSADKAEHLATEVNFTKIEALDAFATERGHTLVELAIGWLLARPGVASVIAGATKPAQITANAGTVWTLTPEEA